MKSGAVDQEVAEPVIAVTNGIKRGEP